MPGKSNDKPTKADLQKLIAELDIDLDALGVKEVTLINQAMKEEDPIGHLQMIAESQKNSDDDQPTEPPAITSGEGTDPPPADPSGAPLPHAKSGNDTMRQSEPVFCPRCTDEANDVFVQCESTNTSPLATRYKCPTKGCDFSIKKIRPKVAAAYKRYNQLKTGPNVKARE